MDITEFYLNNPSFDWKFYLSYYKDLQNANIKSEKDAINHYINYGKKELRRINNNIQINHKNVYISFKTIVEMTNQMYISQALNHLKSQIKKKFNIKTYNNIFKPSIFFGLYTDEDIQIICNHQNIKFIIWGGEDINPLNNSSKFNINQIKKLNNCIHISISDCIYKSLLIHKVSSLRVDFNLVDNSIFKPIKIKNKTKIFIYNGITPGKEHIYNLKLYNNVIILLQKSKFKFTYIYSNKLNIPNENMPSVYEQCFVALRLTHHDGNANMVQECKAMNIPVIHNHSDYGLKWNNENDIIKHITHLYNN